MFGLRLDDGYERVRLRPDFDAETTISHVKDGHAAHLVARKPYQAQISYP